MGIEVTWVKPDEPIRLEFLRGDPENETQPVDQVRITLSRKTTEINLTRDEAWELVNAIQRLFGNDDAVLLKGYVAFHDTIRDSIMESA